MDHLHYLKNDFNNLDLINDSFIEFPLSIHIELEKNLYQFDDSGELNNQYLNNVYSLATDLFDDLFRDDELMYIVTVVHIKNKLRKPVGIYNKFIKQSYKYRLKIKNSKDEEGQVIQYSLESIKQDFAYKKIIKAICNQDFKSLKPRFNDRISRYPEVFFINKDRGIIFHIYDDRGLFIIFNNEQVYKAAKEKYKKLL